MNASERPGARQDARQYCCRVLLVPRLAAAQALAAVQALPIDADPRWTKRVFSEMAVAQAQVLPIGTEPTWPKPVAPKGTCAAQSYQHRSRGTANRSRSLYDNVINQFAVSVNPRYAQRDSNGDGITDTFCNIFVSDVTRAMGAEIPHWANMTTGAPTGVGSGTELGANRTVDWMMSFGANYGWRHVTAQQAQDNANQGKPAVVLWRNPNGPGHEQVVRPGTFSSTRGAYIAQSGAWNTNGAYVRDILPASAGETYWIHD